MKERFESRSMHGNISIRLDDRMWIADKNTLVNDIIEIVEEYEAQGYRLTLRQLYYQLVAADKIPNHDKVYKKIGGILDDCRYSGLLDWESIEDRGRVPKLPYWIKGIKHALDDTIDSYRLNRQLDQQNHIELWTEKDAISNILFRVTAQYHVQLVVNKGYTSSSAIYQAYSRFSEIINSGKAIKILYFGDHDPSGLDMVRDIKDRLLMMFFCGKQVEEETIVNWKEKKASAEAKKWIAEMNKKNSEQGIDYAWIRHHMEHFEVIPIGLTRDQIREYRLPPNPAKITDPRAKEYIKKHGDRSWEVDALRPDVLTEIVRTNIEGLIDIPKYNKMIALEKKQKAAIAKFAKGFVNK